MKPSRAMSHASGKSGDRYRVVSISLTLRRNMKFKGAVEGNMETSYEYGWREATAEYDFQNHMMLVLGQQDNNGYLVLS